MPTSPHTPSHGEQPIRDESERSKLIGSATEPASLAYIAAKVAFGAYGTFTPSEQNTIFDEICEQAVTNAYLAQEVGNETRAFQFEAIAAVVKDIAEAFSTDDEEPPKADKSKYDIFYGLLKTES